MESCESTLTCQTLWSIEAIVGRTRRLKPNNSLGKFEIMPVPVPRSRHPIQTGCGVFRVGLAVESVIVCVNTIPIDTFTIGDGIALLLPGDFSMFMAPCA